MEIDIINEFELSKRIIDVSWNKCGVYKKFDNLNSTEIISPFNSLIVSNQENKSERIINHTYLDNNYNNLNSNNISKTNLNYNFKSVNKNNKDNLQISKINHDSCNKNNDKNINSFYSRLLNNLNLDEKQIVSDKYKQKEEIR